MNPVEFLIYAAAVDLVQTMRFAFCARRTVESAFKIVELGSYLLTSGD